MKTSINIGTVLLTICTALAYAQEAAPASCRTFSIDSVGPRNSEKELRGKLAQVPEFTSLGLRRVGKNESADLRLTVQDQTQAPTIFVDPIHLTRVRDAEARLVVGDHAYTGVKLVERIVMAMVELCRPVQPDQLATSKASTKPAAVTPSPATPSVPLPALGVISVRSNTSALDTLELRRALVRKLNGGKPAVRIDGQGEAIAVITRDLSSHHWTIKVLSADGTLMAKRVFTIILIDDAVERVSDEIAGLLGQGGGQTVRKHDPAPRTLTADVQLEAPDLGLFHGTTGRLVADDNGLHLRIAQSERVIEIPAGSLLDAAKSRAGGSFSSSFQAAQPDYIADPFSAAFYVGYLVIGHVGSATGNYFDRADFLHVAWKDGEVEHETVFRVGGKNAKHFRDYLRELMHESK